MLEIRCQPNLAEEPLGAQHRGQLVPQHLDGDRATVLEIPGQVDCRHAPATKLALDRVAAGEGRLESFEELWQVS